MDTSTATTNWTPGERAAMDEAARHHGIIASWYRTTYGPHEAPNPQRFNDRRTDVAELVEAVAGLVRMERDLVPREVATVRDLAVLVRAAAEHPDDLAGTGGREFTAVIAQVCYGYDRRLAALTPTSTDEEVARAIGHGLMVLG